MTATRRIRRTKYPYRKIRVVLRITEHRENKRATSFRKRNNFAFRANNREVSYSQKKRRFDPKRKQTMFTVEKINERSADSLSRKWKKR